MKSITMVNGYAIDGAEIAHRGGDVYVTLIEFVNHTRESLLLNAINHDRDINVSIVNEELKHNLTCITLKSSAKGTATKTRIELEAVCTKRKSRNGELINNYYVE